MPPSGVLSSCETSRCISRRRRSSSCSAVTSRMMASRPPSSGLVCRESSRPVRRRVPSPVAGSRTASISPSRGRPPHSFSAAGLTSSSLPSAPHSATPSAIPASRARRVASSRSTTSWRRCNASRRRLAVCGTRSSVDRAPMCSRSECSRRPLSRCAVRDSTASRSRAETTTTVIRVASGTRMRPKGSATTAITPSPATRMEKRPRSKVPRRRRSACTARASTKAATAVQPLPGRWISRLERTDAAAEAWAKTPGTGACRGPVGTTNWSPAPVAETPTNTMRSRIVFSDSSPSRTAETENLGISCGGGRNSGRTSTPAGTGICGRSKRAAASERAGRDRPPACLVAAMVRTTPSGPTSP